MVIWSCKLSIKKNGSVGDLWLPTTVVQKHISITFHNSSSFIYWITIISKIHHNSHFHMAS